VTATGLIQDKGGIVDNNVQQWQIPEGTDVVGADGDKVGKVVAAESSYIVVEKGFFFPTDYYIPVSAVNNFDGDKVYLSVTKDEALNQGWDQQLGDQAYDSGSTTYANTTSYVDDGDRLAGVTPTGLADQIDVAVNDTTYRDAGVGVDDQALSTAQSYATTGTDVVEGDTLRVPVHEEELTATTRPVERGQVRIDKTVVAEERTLEVPVTEERVTVTRRVVDQDATGVDANAFQEDTIEIPLRSEEVDLQKRTRVAEEIDIAKDAVQRTEQVTGTVRREEVHVDEASVDRANQVTSS
jgi:uncharacterized protein (TIGR02271 family)